MSYFKGTWRTERTYDYCELAWKTAQSLPGGQLTRETVDYVLEHLESVDGLDLEATITSDKVEDAQRRVLGYFSRMLMHKRGELAANNSNTSEYVLVLESFTEALGKLVGDTPAADGAML